MKLILEKLHGISFRSSSIWNENYSKKVTVRTLIITYANHFLTKNNDLIRRAFEGLNRNIDSEPNKREKCSIEF